MTINKEFLDGLFEKAKESERLRMNYDLRTSEHDCSQRMLNAMLPGTEVTIHRHTRSSENIICLCGRLDVILLKERRVSVQLATAPDMGVDAQDVMCRRGLVEKDRIHLCPENATFGCVVPMGTWHTVQVYDPSVIYETKDGKYGEDGSEIYNGELITPINTVPTDSFHNYLGDLKKNIEYLIGMECQSGSMDVITPLYVSRMLNVPLEEVERVMKDMEI